MANDKSRGQQAERHDKPDKARAIVRAYLCDQVAALLAGDVALRDTDTTDRAEVVHRVRVATRRIRSALRVYGSLFEDNTVEHLDIELSWYQDLLGDDRDAAVQRSHLGAALADLSNYLKLGTAAARIGERLGAHESKTHALVLDAIDTERYRALIADVTELADDPPLLATARPADIRKLTRKAQQAAAKRLRRGLDENDDEELHRARKSIKRARYATELARPLFGDKATDRRLKQYEHAQDVLGAHQDAVAAADQLRELASSTRGNGFTYGVLFEREQQKRRDARQAADKLSI